MIKEAEIECFKVMNMEMRATIEKNDTSMEIRDLKNELQFAIKEKEMKDIMIKSLKEEVEKNMVQFIEFSEKETQMTTEIYSLKA